MAFQGCNRTPTDSKWFFLFFAPDDSELLFNVAEAGENRTCQPSWRRGEKSGSLTEISSSGDRECLHKTSWKFA